MGLLRGEEERVQYMQGLSLYCTVYRAYSWGAAYSVQEKNGAHFKHLLSSKRDTHRDASQFLHFCFMATFPLPLCWLITHRTWEREREDHLVMQVLHIHGKEIIINDIFVLEHFTELHKYPPSLPFSKSLNIVTYSN